MMKPKYKGIIATCFLLGSIFITLIYAVSMPEPEYEFKRERAQSKLPSVYIPSSAVLKKMETAQREMPEIAGLKKSDPAPVNLSIFGYRPVSSSRDIAPFSTENQRLRSLEADYKLSLAFSAGKNSFCVINGTMYSPGDRLPGKARVVKIESQRVMIRKHGSDIWISLAGKSERKLERQGKKERENRDTKP